MFNNYIQTPDDLKVEYKWLADGLVGLWLPDMAASTWYDVSGYGRHGTMTGDWKSGIPGLVAYFDGTSADYVRITNTFDHEPITVAWASRCLISSPTAEGIFGIPRTGPNQLWAYHWNQNSINGVTVHLKYDTSAASIRQAATTASITQADWHYYAMTDDGTTLTFYMDGVVQSGTVSGTPTAPTYSDTYFSRGHDSFYGNIELSYVVIEARLWTAAEIATLYAAQLDAFTRARRRIYYVAPVAGGTTHQWFYNQAN